MCPKKTKQTEPKHTEEAPQGAEARRAETPKEINEVVENVEAKPRPKRKCSEKQLAALAEGRKKNLRLIAKLKRDEERSKELEPRSGEAKLNQSSTNKNQTPDQTAQQTI